MDRLEKIIEIMKSGCSATCCEREGCIYYNGDCNLDYLIEMLFRWDKIIHKDKSIVLKNIDVSSKIKEELYDLAVEESESFTGAIDTFIEIMVRNENNKHLKEYIKEYYMDRILDHLQANINLASAYGITADDIMKHYNTKYLDKLDKRGKSNG